MASHRRVASESSAPARRPRPLSILTPPSSPATQFSSNLPANFQSVLSQLEARKEKIYYEGYLQKCDKYTGSTKSAYEGEWQDVYASLAGTVLSIWAAADLDLADTLGGLSKVPPSFINLMDAQIEQDQRQNQIFITTAGNKRVKLRASSDAEGNTMETKKWTLAIRLSAFERSRMQEAYTANLFLRCSVKDTTNVSNGDEKWTGWVDARICGGDVAQTQWNKLWCTIIDRVERKNLLTKRLSSSSESEIHEREVRFFSDKRSKTPVVIVDSVVAAYACFPEHISLIETSGMIKIEGNVRANNSRSTANSTGYALIIPKVAEKSKRLSLTSFTSDQGTLVQGILKMLYACWSAFNLYNLPERLLLNTNHKNALGFGDNGTCDISLEELLGKISSDCNTADMWRSALREQAILKAHYTGIRGQPLTPQSASFPNIFKRTGSDRRVVSEGAIVPNFRPLVTSIAEDEEHERSTYHDSLPSSQVNTSDPRDLRPHVELVGAGHQQIVTHDKADEENPLSHPSETLNTAVPIERKEGKSTLEEKIARIASRRPKSGESLTQIPNGSHNSINSDNTSTGKNFFSPGSWSKAHNNNKQSTSPIQTKSPKSPGAQESTTPIYRTFAKPRGIQNLRPATAPRNFSYDSHLSERSEGSTYSAGLDLSALALVTELRHDDDDEEGGTTLNSYSKVVSEKDESIYSNDSQATVSDYASTVGEEDDVESVYINDKNRVTDRIQRRASVIEALDIKRQPSNEVLTNPYARPRQR